MTRILYAAVLAYSVVFLCSIYLEVTTNGQAPPGCARAIVSKGPTQ